MPTTSGRTEKYSNFSLLEPLGKGNRGMVYRARMSSGLEAAVKIYPVPENGIKEWERCLRREAILQARVAEDGVPGLLGFGRDGRDFYLAMELLEGNSLRTLLDQVSQLAVPQALGVTYGALCALSHLHRVGLVHGAVRPENIFVEERESIRLLDLGKASLHTSTSRDIAGGTDRAGLNYISPEGSGFFARPIDLRADLYSLGCVLFECLTGRPLFEHSKASLLLKAHAHDTPPRLDPLGVSYQKELQVFLDGLLAKDPSDRFSSAQAAGEALDELLSASGIALLPFQTMAPRGRKLIPLQRDRDVLGRVMPKIVGLEGEPSRLNILTGEQGCGRSAVLRILSGQPPVRGLTVKALFDSENPGELDWADLKRFADDWTGHSSERCLVDFSAMKRGLRRRLMDYAQSVGHLILLVDDFRSVPEGLQTFLIGLCTAPFSESPVSLLTTIREGQQDEVQTQWPGLPITYSTLGPISLEDTEALIGAFLEGELAEGLPQTFRRACGGNPGSLLQILHTLCESGGLDYHEGTWYLRAEAGASLQGAELAMKARLEMLPPQPLELLKYCCLAQDDLTDSTLTEVLSISYPDASDSLHNCLRQGFLLVNSERRIRPVDGLRSLLQSQVRLDSKSHQERHLRLWRSLTRHEPNRFEELAHHADGAGQLLSQGFKFQAFLKAGRQLRTTFHYDRATHWLEKAVRLASSEQLPGTLRELGDAYRHLGQFDKAINCYESGLATSQALPEKVRFLVRKAHTECDAFHFDKAWIRLMQGFKLLEIPLTEKAGLSQDMLCCEVGTPLVELLESAAWVCWFLPPDPATPALLDLTEQSLDLCERPEYRLHLLTARAGFAVATEDKSLARSSFRLALDMARDLNDGPAGARLHSLRTQAFHRLGEPDFSLSNTAELLDRQVGCNSLLMSQTLAADLVTCYLTLGRVQDAWDVLNTASRRWSYLPSGHPLRSYTIWLAHLRENPEISCNSGEVLSEQETTGNSFCWSLAMVAHLAGLFEDPSRFEAVQELAHHFAERGLDPFRSTFFQRIFFIMLAHNYAARALLLEDDKALKVLLPELAPLRDQANFPEHIKYFEAVLAFRDGRESFLVLVSEAEDRSYQRGNRWILGCLMELKGLYYRRTRPEAAMELFEAAAEIAARSGWHSRCKHLRETYQLRASNASGGSDEQELQAWNERGFDALTEVGLALTVTLDLPALGRLALTNFLRALDAQRGHILMVRDSELEPLVGLDSESGDLTECEVNELVLNALETGKPALSNDQHTLASPLNVRGNTLGAVVFQRRDDTTEFGYAELRLLRVLASVLAVNLQIAQNQSLEQKFQAETRQRDFTQRLNSFLNSVMTLRQREEALEAFHRVLLQLFPATRSCYGLYSLDQWDNLGGEEDLMVEARLIDWSGRKRAVSLGESRDGSAWLLVSLERERPKPALFYLQLAQMPEDFALNSLKVLSAQAEIALQNVRLFQEVQDLAIRDELTGIFNRRHIFQCAQEEVDRAFRFKHALSVVMADVDHFKGLNDTYGHQVGDQVLKEVAARLQSCLRKVDRLGRYGGEEFMVLLPGCGEGDAMEVVAERLRQSVCEQPIDSLAGPLTVTISLGVAEFHPSQGTFEEALYQADQALYASKERGRNRATAASELDGDLRQVS